MSITPPQCDEDLWFGRRDHREGLVRLVCLPYAGGGAAIFRSWSNFLPSEIEVCAIQLPGRETRLRETPFTSFGSLVKELTDVLQRHSDKPFAIFGHSMGGLIAFELARQLRRKGARGPSHLFISACRPPQIRDCNPHIHAWPDEAFLAELQDRYGPSPSHVMDAELTQLYLPILRADMAVCESYGFARGAPLDTPITVFSGREDRQLKLAQLARWSTQTKSSFNVEIFPGNHFFWHGNSGPMLKSIRRELTQISQSIVENSFSGK